jgi:hypothetical protein
VKKSKKIFLVVVFAIIRSTTEAQIENVNLGTDSSFVLDRVYAGILGANDFSIDSISRNGFVGLRFGASGKLRVSRAVSVVSFIAEDVTTSGNSIGGSGFLVRLQPEKSWYVAIGHGPQVGTFLHRAHPASAGGQFETFTHRAIPGPGPGIRLVKSFGKTDVLASTAVVDGSPEYHLGVAFGTLASNVWWREGLWGSATTYKSKHSKTILVIRSDLWASTVTYNLPKSYILYTDVGIETGSYRLVRAEAGILRTFEATSYVKGLFGLGYAHELRSVRGYIFVTL